MTHDIYLNDAINLFAQERKDLSTKTLKDYSHTLNCLIGNMPIQRIDKAHIQTFLQTYQNPATYNTKLYGIRAFFSWASDYYEIRDPSKGLRALSKEKNIKTGVISKSIYEQIHTLSGHYRDIAVFICNTGLRASEFCSMRPKHFDIEKRTLKISGTVTENRIIPLNNVAFKLVLKYHPINSYPINYIKTKAKYYEKHNLKYAFHDLADKLGIKYFGTQALRDYFANSLIEYGVNVAVVAQLLGHSNILSTFNKYYNEGEEIKFIERASYESMEESVKLLGE